MSQENVPQPDLTQNGDLELDHETLQEIAHLTGQTARDLKDLDQMVVGGSQNMKGLQYDPKELIQKNFLSRVPRNPNRPVAVPQQQPAQQPMPQQPTSQQVPQPAPQPVPQQVQNVYSEPQISSTQYNLLIEKLCTVERLLGVCIEGQDELQNALNKSLDKLLQKKLKEFKITFKDDDN